jgi:hypothetical protein
MKHTFHLSFPNHLGEKRRYCFSLPDAELRTIWGVLLPRQAAITRQRKSVPASTAQAKIKAAAEAVALLVLRDALVPSHKAPHRAQRSGSVSVVHTQEGEAGKKEQHEHGSSCREFMAETTGKEVVLVCRQNSLLPGMLELLQAGGGEMKDRGERF